MSVAKTDREKERKDRLTSLKRVFQAAQEGIGDLLYSYKQNNEAIRHIAILDASGDILARCPDEEGQNQRMLDGQYNWLAIMIGSTLESLNGVSDDYKKFRDRRITKDFGRPKLVRIATEHGESVSQIFGTPMDADSLAFVVITSRAATRRNAIVANEALLLEDLDALVQDLLKLDALSPLNLSHAPSKKGEA